MKEIKLFDWFLRFEKLQKELFRKSPLNGLYTPFCSPICGEQKPSLPLRKAPPFSPSLSSIVFTTPSVPLVGDRNPQGREDVAGSAIAPPGFWSASGACALKGWLGVLTQQSCECLSASALRNLLIACRFSAFFLVVSIKKRTFAAE